MKEANNVFALSVLAARLEKNQYAPEERKLGVRSNSGVLLYLIVKDKYDIFAHPTSFSMKVSGKLYDICYITFASKLCKKNIVLN